MTDIDQPIGRCNYGVLPACKGLDNELGHSREKTDHHPCHRPFSVDSLEEQAEQEDRCDRRGEIALDALEILIQPALGDSLHHGNPDNAHGHYKDCCNSADGDEVPLGRLRVYLLIDIDGEER